MWDEWCVAAFKHFRKMGWTPVQAFKAASRYADHQTTK